jgi:ankyrin repeat protein
VAEGGLAATFLGLACLTYADDGPDRWRDAVALLGEHPDLPRHDVHVAAATGDTEALAELLRADPGLADARRPDGFTPLMSLTYARVPQSDPYGAARLLLDAGADPDAGVLLGGEVPPFTVLTGCFGEGEQGPGRTPRHPQGEALAELLLDHGADPNDGQTLYNRMFGRDDGHLRVLLAHGLGRGDGGTWRRRLGERQATPQRMVALQVDRARDHGLTDRVALLAAYGFVEGTPDDDPSPWRARDLPPVAAAGTPDGVRALAAAGDPVTGSGQVLDAKVHGRTLLHHAAWADDVELVQALLACGADPQVLDDDHGATPLGWARWAYAARTVALLEPVTREV